MNFSSKLLENAVNEFATLPGIGQKTALRLVLHLLNRFLIAKLAFALQHSRALPFVLRAAATPLLEFAEEMSR